MLLRSRALRWLLVLRMCHWSRPLFLLMSRRRSLLVQRWRGLPPGRNGRPFRCRLLRLRMLHRCRTLFLHRALRLRLLSLGYRLRVLLRCRSLRRRLLVLRTPHRSRQLLLRHRFLLPRSGLRPHCRLLPHCGLLLAGWFIQPWLRLRLCRRLYGRLDAAEEAGYVLPEELQSSSIRQLHGLSP